MRLTELDPQFVHVVTKNSYMLHESPALTPDVQGIIFLCPTCFKKNGGPVGTHSVLVFFKDRGVPPECEPLPRWGVSGSSLDDLTITPSIDLSVSHPGEWHGFVINGEVT